ncbi:hypothetical protein M885DRAFT_542901 [Pelagophyceae sp. CCMP2097]|nr:hypothetical protein M885DRAFT_542901 [Pelagophyceae sp. CCMP2097]
MNEYGASTLNQNWFEERSPPLHGVLADYGVRQYATTSKEAFPERASSSTTSRAAILRQRALSSHEPNVFTMTQKGNAAEALKVSLVAGVVGNGFDEDRETSFPVDERFQTSYRHAYCDETREPVENTRAIAHSGMSGEVFKTHDDPQHDTKCQRVWLPCNNLIKPADRALRAP